MKTTSLILFFLCSACYNPATAQWYVGNDFGVLSYDVKDEMISYLRYEKVTSSLLNLSIHHIGEKNQFTARYGNKDTRLKLAEAQEFFVTNMMYFQNHELDLEYLRKVQFLRSGFEVFLGGAYNGHFSYYERSYESRFTSGFQTSHEMAAVNFSLDGLIQYRVKEHLFQYKAGVSLYNYGSRPEEARTGGTFNMSGFGFKDYVHVQNSLIGFITLSDRWLLKPEYRLRYYTYSQPNRLKFLKQSFFVGIYFRL